MQELPGFFFLLKPNNSYERDLYIQDKEGSEILGFYSSEDSSQGLLGCDAM
jgi:hypothetical protein